jgi:pre-mRNA-splicing factor 18
VHRIVDRRAIMDLLKKEMERKKMALSLARDKTSCGRFVKASDLRRAQEVEEERLRHKRPRLEANQSIATTTGMIDATTTTTAPTGSVGNRGTPATQETAMHHDGKEETRKTVETVTHPPTLKTVKTLPVSKKSQSDSVPNSSSITSSLKISPLRLLEQLRSLGLPIALFGESLDGKLQRLQDALDKKTFQSKTQTDMDEFRLGKGHGIRNPFLNRKGEEDDDVAKKKTVAVVGGVGEPASAEAVARKQQEEENHSSNDPHKNVYRYLKGLLNQWEDDLALRPDATKRTAAGKNETKTLKQCKDYIRPLFKQLKTRKLEEGLLHHMIKIVDYCKEGEFVRAHDSYLDLAIGRSAWPIGVTMVGIHARSGRAKIEAANVAHVMNSELHRKYLTSVKRLMTYAQKKADNVDPSKKVLN